MQRIEALGADHGRTLVEILREHACKVALDPLMVMVDDGNPDHLPVEFLNIPKLMAIWTATALVPQVGQTAAATFRRRTRSDDADVVPDWANTFHRRPVSCDTPRSRICLPLKRCSRLISTRRSAARPRTPNGRMREALRQQTRAGRVAQDWWG